MRVLKINSHIKGNLKSKINFYYKVNYQFPVIAKGTSCEYIIQLLGGSPSDTCFLLSTKSWIK